VLVIGRAFVENDSELAAGLDDDLERLPAEVKPVDPK
jgi:hypothetical protein